MILVRANQATNAMADVVVAMEDAGLRAGDARGMCEGVDCSCTMYLRQDLMLLLGELDGEEGEKLACALDAALGLVSGVVYQIYCVS